MHPNPTQSATQAGPPQDEIAALQVQNRNLQVLVGELLVQNEQLRLRLAQQEMAATISATATPPPQYPDR